MKKFDYNKLLSLVKPENKDHAANMAAYAKERKELKASLLASLNDKTDYLEAARGIREAAKAYPATGAQATAASTWIADVRQALEKKHPGFTIKPVKMGKEILNYELTAIENKATENLVASLTSLQSRFPELFIAGLTVETIRQTIEDVEQNAAKIERINTIKAQTSAAIAALKAEMSRATATLDSLAPEVKKAAMPAHKKMIEAMHKEVAKHEGEMQVAVANC